MKTDNPVTKVLMPVARVLALIAGYMLLLLSLLVTAEVLLRRFANHSLQGSDEYGGYVLAILASFGFAYAMIERAHTRVEILIESVSPRKQAVLHLLTYVGMATMAIFMAWRAIAALMESIEYRSLSGTPLMTPLWQPQSLWVAGLVFFAITALAIALHVGFLLLSDWRSLNRFYGVKAVGQIIDEETLARGDVSKDLLK